MIDAGCVGIVPFGSLGEAATLQYAEKIRVIETLVEALGDKAPVIPMIGSLSTAEAVQLTKDAEAAGASGFMVLAPDVYSGDEREMSESSRAILRATTK